MNYKKLFLNPYYYASLFVIFASLQFLPLENYPITTVMAIGVFAGTLIQIAFFNSEEPTKLELFDALTEAEDKLRIAKARLAILEEGNAELSNFVKERVGWGVVKNGHWGPSDFHKPLLTGALCLNTTGPNDEWLYSLQIDRGFSVPEGAEWWDFKNECSDKSYTQKRLKDMESEW